MLNDNTDVTMLRGIYGTGMFLQSSSSSSYKVSMLKYDKVC